VIKGIVLVSALLPLGCGLIPQRVSHDDPRLEPMFEAMSRVDRASMGFTPIAADATIRLEWAIGRSSYDAMLHVYGRTSKTIAFRRSDDGHEWIGEQEIFKGPAEYTTVDGTFNEQIVITYERVHISGAPLNTVSVSYMGEEPDLAWPKELSLDIVRPWLRKWGYS
jgi:hypothetical protein